MKHINRKISHKDIRKPPPPTPWPTAKKRVLWYNLFVLASCGFTFVQNSYQVQGSFRVYVRLHLVVLIFGFTAILGKLLSLSAVGLVAWRTGLAALGLAAILWFRGNSFRVKNPLALLGTGVIVALHWLLFFGAIQVGNVSVALAGIATGTLWMAFLDPLFSSRSLRWVEVFLSAITLIGLYLIYLFTFDKSLGLLMAVASAGFGAVFSILNARFVNETSPEAITLYEMLAACGTTLVGIPIFGYFSPTLILWPTGYDWLWLALLAGVCSVFAYTETVSLLKKISAFTFNLTLNLEPVYGILLAYLFFQKSEEMTLGFYSGAGIILAAVLAYPFIEKKP